MSFFICFDTDEDIQKAAIQNKYTQQQKDSLSEIFAEIRKAVNDEWKEKHEL